MKVKGVVNGALAWTADTSVPMATAKSAGMMPRRTSTSHHSHARTASARGRANVEQIEKPRLLALAREPGDPDVVREKDDVVIRTVVGAPELIRNLALELRAQLANEGPIV